MNRGFLPQIVDRKEAISKYPVLKKIPDNYENNITIVYASNTTTELNYKPMTPWITMHRLFHLFNLLFHGEAFKEDELSRLFGKYQMIIM